MKIYVCSTYYHLLISVLKVISGDTKSDLVLLDFHLWDKSLSDRIEETGLFRNVISLRGGDYSRINTKGWKSKLFDYKKKEKEINADFYKINLSNYDDIIVFMDDTWFARMLKNEKREYSICEDSLNVFRYILDTPFSYMVQTTLIKRIIRFFFPNSFLYKYYLDCKLIKKIEVNDKDNICLKNNERIVAAPRNELFAQLNDSNKLKTALSIFCPSGLSFETPNTIIIFTYCFKKDNLVGDELKIINNYKLVVNYYKDSGNNVMIKPHPRDEIDYSSYVKCAIIPKNFPSELILYSDNKNIKGYVSVFSKCLQAYPKDKAFYYDSFEDFKIKNNLKEDL